MHITKHCIFMLAVLNLSSYLLNIMILQVNRNGYVTLKKAKPNCSWGIYKNTLSSLHTLQDKHLETVYFFFKLFFCNIA